MDTESFIQRIRDYFPFLFETYGFRIVFCELNHLRPEYVLIGLESDHCRLAFEIEETEFASLIGPRSAKFGQSGTSVDAPSWLSVEWLIDFLSGHAHWPDGEAEPSVDEILQNAAATMEPHCAELCTMFSSADAIAQWYPRYQAFIAEALHLP